MPGVMARSASFEGGNANVSSGSVVRRQPVRPSRRRAGCRGCQRGRPEDLPVAVKPLDWFKPDPKELARHDDPEKVRLMGEDMKAHGQLADVLACEDARMISGHGRLLAAARQVSRRSG